MPRAAPLSDFWRRLVEMIGKEVTVKQKEVAIYFGVGQSAVTKWKTGKDTPSLPRAVEMATYHGVCVEWLLTGRGPKYPGDTPDAELSRLLEFWDDLEEPVKHEIVGYAVYKGAVQPKPEKPDKPIHSSHRPTRHK